MVFETKRYHWLTRSRYKVSADIVGKKLEQIEAETGSVSKEALLEASRSEKSETHDLFEWNDGVAAEKYRLRQAQDVIANIAVEVISHENKTEKVGVEFIEPNEIAVPSRPQMQRAFVNTLPSAPFSQSRFESIDKALDDSEKRTIVLKNAIREARMYKDKYIRLTELSGLFAAIDEVVAEIGEV